MVQLNTIRGISTYGSTNRQGSHSDGTALTFQTRFPVHSLSHSPPGGDSCALFALAPMQRASACICPGHRLSLGRPPSVAERQVLSTDPLPPA